MNTTAIALLGYLTAPVDSHLDADLRAVAAGEATVNDAIRARVAFATEATVATCTNQSLDVADGILSADHPDLELDRAAFVRRLASQVAADLTAAVAR